MEFAFALFEVLVQQTPAERTLCPWALGWLSLCLHSAPAFFLTLFLCDVLNLLSPTFSRYLAQRQWLHGDSKARWLKEGSQKTKTRKPKRSTCTGPFEAEEKLLPFCSHFAPEAQGSPCQGARVLGL